MLENLIKITACAVFSLRTCFHILLGEVLQHRFSLLVSLPFFNDGCILTYLYLNVNSNPWDLRKTPKKTLFYSDFSTYIKASLDHIREFFCLNAVQDAKGKCKSIRR